MRDDAMEGDCSLAPASELENETTGDVHEDERGDDLVFHRVTVLYRPAV